MIVLNSDTFFVSEVNISDLRITNLLEFKVDIVIIFKLLLFIYY
jgi:hypothetical protein